METAIRVVGVVRVTCTNAFPVAELKLAELAVLKSISVIEDVVEDVPIDVDIVQRPEAHALETILISGTVT